MKLAFIYQLSQFRGAAEDGVPQIQRQDNRAPFFVLGKNGRARVAEEK
jgi:hypothetical protein